jgi:hypothetical protein
MGDRLERWCVCVLTGDRPPDGDVVEGLRVFEGVDAWALDADPSDAPSDVLSSLGTLQPASSPRTRLDELRAAEGFDDDPAIDPMLRDALFRQGRTTDFFTGEEREKVRFHLFALVSDRSPSGRFVDLIELCEAIAFHDLPFVVHAVLDGVHMAPKSAWPLLEELEERIAKRGGVIGTLMGSAWALDRSGSWTRTLACYEAIVRGDVDVLPSVHAALEVAYRDGHDDASMPPVRIGDYRGLVGELCAELPGGAWEWRGEEVGLWLGLDPDGAHALVSALLRRSLPAPIEGLLALRGRSVFAFAPSSLASLVPLAPALELPSVCSRRSVPVLLSALAEGGVRALHLLDPRVRVRAECAGFGPVDGVELATVEMPVHAPRGTSIAGPPPELPMEVVFEAMQAALARGEEPPAPPSRPHDEDAEATPDPPRFDPVPELVGRAQQAIAVAEGPDLVWLTLDASTGRGAPAALVDAAREAGAGLLVVDATNALDAPAGRAWVLGPRGQTLPSVRSTQELGAALLRRLGVAAPEPLAE